MELWYVASKGVVGTAIRAFEGGEANHVGIVLGPDLIIEADLWKGVRTLSVADFLKGRRVVSVHSFTLPDEFKAREFLHAQIGKKYDVSAIIGFLFWRNWSRGDTWYCSELAIAAALAGGMKLVDRHVRIGVRLSRELAHAWATVLPSYSLNYKEAT